MSHEEPLTRCPTCDGAMLQNPERCVRCGPPQMMPTTLRDLVSSGAEFRLDAPSAHRRYAQTIYIGNSHFVLVQFCGNVVLCKRYRHGKITPDPVVLVRVDARVPAGDEVYWLDVRRQVLELFPERMRHFSGFLWKRVKETRLSHEAKGWASVLPDEIVKWANGVLGESSKGEDCVDNYRVARIGNTSQQRRYRRQKRAGCCGCKDFVRQGPDGVRYMLGYNFGH